MFQVYNSIMHYLYILLCVHHLKASLFPSPFIPPLFSLTFPIPIPPPIPLIIMIITILLSMSMRVFIFIFCLILHLFHPTS